MKLVFLKFQRVGLLKALVHLFLKELVFWAEQSLFQFCFAERWEFEFAFWLWLETGIRLARTLILQAEFAVFGATESAVGRFFVFFVRVSLHPFVATPVRLPRRRLELFEHVVVTRKPVKPPVQTAWFRILTNHLPGDASDPDQVSKRQVVEDEEQREHLFDARVLLQLWMDAQRLHHLESAVAFDEAMAAAHFGTFF